MMNTYFPVFKSAARTATVTSDDLDNRYSKGVILTLDVTAVTSGASITLSVDFKDPTSGKYETYFTATPAVTATGTHSYMIYPGVGEPSGDIVQTASLALPKIWRVKVTHADNKSVTYSVGANLLL